MDLSPADTEQLAKVFFGYIWDDHRIRQETPEDRRIFEWCAAQTTDPHQKGLFVYVREVWQERREL